jgi:hypothetical protein
MDVSDSVSFDLISSYYYIVDESAFNDSVNSTQVQNSRFP